MVVHILFVVQNQKQVMKSLVQMLASRYSGTYRSVDDVEHPLHYEKFVRQMCRVILQAVKTQQHGVHCDRDSTSSGSHRSYGARHLVDHEIGC